MSRLGSGSSSSPQLIRQKHVAISMAHIPYPIFFFIRVQSSYQGPDSNLPSLYQFKINSQRTKYDLNNLRLPKSLWPTKNHASITKIYTIFVSTHNRHVVRCEQCARITKIHTIFVSTCNRHVVSCEQCELGVFQLFFRFRRYFGHFLGFWDISIIFQVSGYFGNFLGFRDISVIFQVLEVFWSFFRFWRYFGNFLGFGGILVFFFWVWGVFS